MNPEDMQKILRATIIYICIKQLLISKREENNLIRRNLEYFNETRYQIDEQ